MNKIEFLSALEQRLAKLPESDKQRSIHYFEEIIDDRVEEGLSEEEAVADLESVDEIADRILSEVNDVTEAAPREEKKRFHNCPLWLVILLAVVGAPIWVPVVFSVGVTLISIYTIPWFIILGFFATALGCFFGGLAGLVLSFFVGAASGGYAGIFCIGASILCIGLGILLIYPSVLFTKWMAKGTAWCYRKIVAIGKGKKNENKKEI